MKILEYYFQMCIGLKDKPQVRDLGWLFKIRLQNVDINDWGEVDISDEDAVYLAEGLHRILQGEPLAYIVGGTDFFWCDIGVNNSVLIPRPETEQLCEIVSKEIGDEMKVLDLCTGSGCIAIGLKKATPNCQIDAVDISPEALEVAKDNAKRNAVEINFVQSDMWQNVDGIYDVIVSNPPYISSKVMKKLPKSVVDYEPHLALFGGDDGLDYYRNIAENSPKFLVPGGRLYLEVGDNQAKKVAKILSNNFTDIEIQKDLFGKTRFVFARRK